MPSFLSFAVVNLLEKHFGRLVDYDFTAQMEDDLDRIARGEAQAVPWLRRFYFGERATVGGRLAADAGNGDGDHLGGLKELVDRPRRDRRPRDLLLPRRRRHRAAGRPLRPVRRARRAATPRTTSAPTSPRTCRPDELTVEYAEELLAKPSGDFELGTDPATGHQIVAKDGRYGPYVTEVLPEGTPKTGKNAVKPRTASLFKSMSLDTVTLDDALKLMSLPRVVGADAEGVEITAQNGRYGPYLKKGTDSRSLETEEQLFTITLDEALAIYAQPKQRGRAAAKPPLKELGTDPVSEQPVVVKDGRFGPYVTDGETNATLRQDDDVETITPERGYELLAEKRAKGPAKKTAEEGAAKKAPAKKAPPRRRRRRRPPAKKTAAKKTTAAKKATAKKAAAAKKTHGAADRVEPALAGSRPGRSGGIGADAAAPFGAGRRACRVGLGGVGAVRIGWPDDASRAANGRDRRLRRRPGRGLPRARRRRPAARSRRCSGCGAPSSSAASATASACWCCVCSTVQAAVADGLVRRRLPGRGLRRRRRVRRAAAGDAALRRRAARPAAPRSPRPDGPLDRRWTMIGADGVRLALLIVAPAVDRLDRRTTPSPGCSSPPSSPASPSASGPSPRTARRPRCCPRPPPEGAAVRPLPDHLDALRRLDLRTGFVALPLAAAALVVVTLVNNLLGAGVDWFDLHQAALASYVAAGLFAASLSRPLLPRTARRAAPRARAPRWRACAAQGRAGAAPTSGRTGAAPAAGARLRRPSPARSPPPSPSPCCTPRTWAAARSASACWCSR